MNREVVLQKIVDVLANEFEIDRAKLVPEARLVEDLDLDSIDAVDLIVRIRSETGIKVNAEDFKKIRTLNDVAEVVARLVASSGK